MTHQQGWRSIPKPQAWCSILCCPRSRWVRPYLQAPPCSPKVMPDVCFEFWVMSRSRRTCVQGPGESSWARGRGTWHGDGAASKPSSAPLSICSPCVPGGRRDLGPPIQALPQAWEELKRFALLNLLEKGYNGWSGASKEQRVVWGIQSTTGARGHPKLSWSEHYYFFLLFFLLSIRCSPCFLMSSRVRTRPWSLSAKSKGSGGESREERAEERPWGHLHCACVPGESQHVLEGWWHHREPSCQALQVLLTGSSTPVSQGDLQDLATPLPWPISNTAGASHKGLEPRGGGHSSRFIEKRWQAAKNSVAPQRTSNRRRPQTDPSTGYSSQPGDFKDKGLPPCPTAPRLVPAVVQRSPPHWLPSSSHIPT